MSWPTDDIKAVFAANPRKLVDALGLRVDEARSKGADIWAYDGNEEKASLVAHSDRSGHPGLCVRWGDDWKGDCFELVRRYRPQDSFKTRAEFVAGVYGIAETEPEKRAPRQDDKPVSDSAYRIELDGRCVAVHRRLDYADGSKRMWWESPEGRNGVPEGVKLSSLPLWRMPDALQRKPGSVVIVCEGEKDTDAVWAIGGVAVGTYGADVIPSPEVMAAFIGRRIILWPDNDAPGTRHMAQVGEAIVAAGISANVLKWEGAPSKGGAADFVQAGGDHEALVELVKSAGPLEIAADDEAAERAVSMVPYAAPEGKLLRGAVSVAHTAIAAIEAVEQARNLPRAVRGMRTGFWSWDDHFGGFSPAEGLRGQQLIVVGGKTKMGKTTFARHCMYATAEAILADGSDDRILAYVLEGGADQFLRYYICYHYGVSWKLLEPGGEQIATDEQRTLIARGYGTYPMLPIDLATDIHDPAQIEADIRRRCDEGPVCGVVLDNIQLLQWSGGNDYQNNKAAAARFAALAEEARVPIMCLSQVKVRDGDTSVRGGPDWEYAASLFIEVTRGEEGQSREERVASLKTTVSILGSRWKIPPAPLKLIGNPKTSRLYEEDEYNRLQQQTNEYQPHYADDRRSF